MAVLPSTSRVLGGVEDEIVECFRKGGGVPYEKFPRFHEVMAEDSGQSVLSSLESHVLPLVPGLTDQLAQGIRVFDVGCGSGRIMIRLAALISQQPIHRHGSVAGGDRRAREEARPRGCGTSSLYRDAERFRPDSAEPEAYDFITTFDAIHDQARPLNVLKGIHRTLKPDGVYLMQDIRGSSHVHKNIGHPIGPFLYTCSTMHCMTVSLAQGGEGLGAMWGEEKTLEYLAECRFPLNREAQLAHDIQNNWYVVRK